MCRLLETIRVSDGLLQNITLHNERLNRSRRDIFKTGDDIDLTDYISVPQNLMRGIIKCRVLYSKEITGIEFEPYIPHQVRTLKLVEANHLFYNYKYTDRRALSSLIDRRSADDILIIKNGNVTDISFANIVFTDGKEWITPDTPLLRGTMREWLLSKKIIYERRITARDIAYFSHFRLINAMLGFDGPILPVDNILE